MFFHCSRGIIRVWLGTGRDYKSDYFFYDLFHISELLTYEQVAGCHHYCSGKITKLSSGQLMELKSVLFQPLNQLSCVFPVVDALLHAQTEISCMLFQPFYMFKLCLLTYTFTKLTFVHCESCTGFIKYDIKCNCNKIYTSQLLEQNIWHSLPLDKAPTSQTKTNACIFLLRRVEETKEGSS